MVLVTDVIKFGTLIVVMLLYLILFAVGVVLVVVVGF